MLIPIRVRCSGRILMGLEPSAGLYSATALETLPSLKASLATSALRDAGHGRSWEEKILRT